MQVYDCKVRLAGELKNEVAKFGCTAAEIMVLRHIHGQDSVVGLRKTVMDKRPHLQERQRLDDIYGRKATTAIFGVPGAQLPVTLDPASEEAIATAEAEREKMINDEVDRRIAEMHNAGKNKLTLSGAK